jgi:hypothetical protein
MYRHRAHVLAEQAKEARNESDRRHMLELVAIYERTADNLAPAPSAASEASMVSSH